MAGVGTSCEVVDPAFGQAILPTVRYVEVIPETLAVRGGGRPIIPTATLEQIAGIAEQATLIVHGVGLSIGSTSGWNENHFRLLDQILNVAPVAWHSEHLGFVEVDGRFLGTMLCLPRTDEVLTLVARRIEVIRRRYGLPFLIENVVNILPDPPAAYSEAAFLNALAHASGCGVLLDVYNLECNACNQGYDAAAFLDELDLSRVREIHVAGGTRDGELMLDVHSRRTQEATRRWLSAILPRASGLEAVVYELMPEAVPLVGHAAWADELRALDALLRAA